MLGRLSCWLIRLWIDCVRIKWIVSSFMGLTSLCITMFFQRQWKIQRQNYCNERELWKGDVWIVYSDKRLERVESQDKETNSAISDVSPSYSHFIMKIDWVEIQFKQMWIYKSKTSHQVGVFHLETWSKPGRTIQIHRHLLRRQRMRRIQNVSVNSISICSLFNPPGLCYCTPSEPTLTSESILNQNLLQKTLILLIQPKNPQSTH